MLPAKLIDATSRWPIYADRFKRRPVRKHHYRAAVIAGIQPARSGVLLDDADGGTPQRWLWLPTDDPERKNPTEAMEGPAPAFRWQDYEVWTPYSEGIEQGPEVVKGGHRIRQLRYIQPA